MITRIWRGWTNAENADAYEELLLAEVFPGIVSRRIEGFVDVSLLRRVHEREVEFVTVMLFASLGAVVAFAGEAYASAVVPPKARELLARFDAEAAHYETIKNRLNA